MRVHVDMTNWSVGLHVEYMHLNVERKSSLDQPYLRAVFNPYPA